MLETVHIWTENPIYCYKLRKVLIADQAHLRNECQTCPFYHGSAQGQGVENVYYDGTNAAQAQNPDPYELEREMASMPDVIVQQVMDAKLHQAKMSRLSVAMKALTRDLNYKIFRGDVYKGRLSFAPDVVLSLNSQDVALVNQIQKMIVNPVHWNGKDNPPGSDDYPQAVIDTLQKLGYVLEIA